MLQNSNSEAQADPLLPQELERDIFETTARAHPGTAAVLALVAHRAQIWLALSFLRLPSLKPKSGRMEALIYETVTLSDSHLCRRFLFTVDSRPPHFFEHHVKTLCIPGDIRPEHAKRILSVCQGVINLAYWITSWCPPPPFALIAPTLRPRQLSFNTYGLFHLTTPPDFTLPFFARVTHLEVVDWPFIAESCQFERLPSLRYLAVDIDQYGHAIVLELRRILNECQHLAVLLCLVRQQSAMSDVEEAFRLVGDDDIRLVILPDSEPLENWEASLDLASDNCQWSCAERIIEERRRALGK